MTMLLVDLLISLQKDKMFRLLFLVTTAICQTLAQSGRSSICCIIDQFISGLDTEKNIFPNVNKNLLTNNKTACRYKSRKIIMLLPRKAYVMKSEINCNCLETN